MVPSPKFQSQFVMLPVDETPMVVPTAIAGLSAYEASTLPVTVASPAVSSGDPLGPVYRPSSASVQRPDGTNSYLKPSPESVTP